MVISIQVYFVSVFKYSNIKSRGYFLCNIQYPAIVLYFYGFIHCIEWLYIGVFLQGDMPNSFLSSKYQIQTKTRNEKKSMIF